MLAPLPQGFWKVLPISVSSLALVIALRNYLRKSGISIRGYFQIVSSITCEDPYVSSYVLENLKDRSVAVYKVYLRIGCGCYIELQDFEDSPLVLKPFETYKSSFGPIEFYAVNMDKLPMKALLERETRKRLVLACSEGKYVVKKYRNYWDAIGDFFQNYATTIVLPIRSTYKGRAVGGNVQYLLELTFEGGENQVIELHKDTYQYKGMEALGLTKDSLASKEWLESTIEQQRQSGKLRCASFKIYDMKEWRAKSNESYSPTTSTLRSLSFLEYHILGRIGTWQKNREFRQVNSQGKATKNSNPRSDSRELNGDDAQKGESESGLSVPES